MIRCRAAALAPLALLLATACEPGPKLAQQTGMRGQGLEQIVDPDNVKEASAIPAPPFVLSPTSGEGPRMQGQNIQVLGDLSQEQFTHAMSSFSQWVGGDAANCGFCHNPANMADDSNYRMQVARQMIRMTRALNSQWSTHTGQTGVTCYTCHRGNAVPENYWTNQIAANGYTIRGNRRGQNMPNGNVGYASLPYGAFGAYFAGNPAAVRISSDSPYPGANPLGTRAAETSYAVMMHVSQSLGVNCTYCHNSQSFRAWNLSSAQRATAWYGINMVRDINQTHIAPLGTAGLFPRERLGPAGDPFKVNCLTCHQGLARPLGGRSMLADHPYLRAAGQAAAPAVPAPVPDALRNPRGMTDQGAPPNAPAEEEGEEQ